MQRGKTFRERISRVAATIAIIRSFLLKSGARRFLKKESRQIRSFAKLLINQKLSLCSAFNKKQRNASNGVFAAFGVFLTKYIAMLNKFKFASFF